MRIHNAGWFEAWLAITKGRCMRGVYEAAEVYHYGFNFRNTKAESVVHLAATSSARGVNRLDQRSGPTAICWKALQPLLQ
jgi:hypothetical protein